MTNNQIQYAKHVEDNRHNLVMESLTGEANAIAAQNAAANMLNAQTAAARASEDARHNLAVEAENRRANTLNYVVNENRNTETQRHNLEVEQETVAQNQRVLEETQRHNQTVESIDAARNELTERGQNVNAITGIAETWMNNRTQTRNTVLRIIPSIAGFLS